MKAIGKNTKKADKERLFIQVETPMKVYGKKTREMDKERKFNQMVPCKKANGKTTYFKAIEKNIYSYGSTYEIEWVNVKIFVGV